MNLQEAKRTFFVLAVVLAFAGQARSASAQSITVTLSLQLPFVSNVFVPCANAGAGEFVRLSGNLHEVVHATFDVNGNIHARILDQPQGISGVGQTSGAMYRGAGITQQMSNTNVFSFVTTFVNNFLIIGQGTGNNFLLHQFGHITINANGETTANVDFISVECR